MKKWTIAALVLAVTLLPAAGAWADSWTGWITDNHCGAKGAKAGHEACAKKCVAGGGHYVLYNTADEKTYKLDNQEMAEANLGYEVVVTGTMEDGTIQVESIAEAESEG